jgi:hypothetical protein
MGGRIHVEMAGHQAMLISAKNWVPCAPRLTETWDSTAAWPLIPGVEIVIALLPAKPSRHCSRACICEPSFQVGVKLAIN